MTVGVETIETYSLQSWYSDLTLAVVINDDNAQWLKSQMRRAIKAGLRKVATKISSDVFNHMYTADVLADLEKVGVTSRNVANKEEAMKRFDT
jgi:hypothetical protein